jgi:diguanylate cyclase (GGDEF)-like protein/PAS domain S-box-containing protein
MKNKSLQGEHLSLLEDRRNNNYYFRLIGTRGNNTPKTKINKKIEEKLQISEQHYISLFENNPDAVYSFDLLGKFTSANYACEVLTGYGHSELMKMTFKEILHPNDLQLGEVTFGKIIQGSPESIEVRLIHKTGRPVHVKVSAFPIVINDEIVGVYGISKDITEKKKAQELIQQLAYQDYLTGLPNRNMLKKHLFQIISNSSESIKLSLLFIDLDRFKVINDTLGHSMGDELLKEVSKRLKSTISIKDKVFRLNGDEFVVLIQDEDREYVSHLASRIISVLASPFKINNYDVFTTPSIGISEYEDNEESGDMLIKHAESAMYQAKKAGNNVFKFYSSVESESDVNPFILEMELHKAIERNELILHYQPKINLKTGHVIGTEALIRWNHPKWGLVSPANFIPIAEENGLIIPIGEWALRKACAQNKKWQEQGFSELTISVNLSTRQFSQSILVQTVKTILDETGLEPKYLELEITESMTADIERSIKTLNELKSLGIQISIDDFGTGFSSLNYLKRFPVDTLKIDQSFVKELHNNPSDETIVKTIISMAHSLNLNVVAEGIETQEQLVFLQRHLCEGGQGYFFSKPLPAKDLEERLSEIGEKVKQFGINQEVNERIWTEEKVRMAKQELQETLRLQQGMTLKFKKINGRFIHTLCDGELLYRFGCIPDQVIGKELSEFLPEEIAKEKLQFYKAAWAGEENVTYEVELNGIHYLASLRPIKRGGEVVEVIGSCIDITERKEVEKALLESERKYRLIAENMTDLIVIFDVNGIIQYASPSHEVMLGHPVSHIEGKSFFNNLHPDEKETQIELFKETVQSKIPRKTDFRMVKRDGSWGEFEIVLTPVVDDSGMVNHIVGVARDITEKKRAEELLGESEKLSLVGELAAGVAHEIRNPITSIKGFFQLFKEGNMKDEYFDIATREFNRIEEIISGFINLATPQEVELKHIDIKTLVNEVIQILLSEMNLRNIQIFTEFDRELPMLECDPNQIRQVIINIIKNSMEALPRGGEIHVEVCSDGNELLMSIEDNGIGMSQDRIDRLGEPFYCTKEKGTGLGIMKCNRIIKEHNGQINFSSKEFVGTTVEVRLPLGQATKQLPN